MGRRKVILHVGQSKAGSTSIQNYLEKQRLQLSKSGFLFPKSVFLRQNPFDATRTPGHLKFLRDLESDQLGDFERELEAEPDSTLILSIENLFSDQPDLVLDKVANYFTDWDVHIVAVLREQSAWLRSRYVENTMSGFSNRIEHLSTFVSEMIERGTLNYNERLEFLRRRLKAQSSCAINFDSTHQALVPRFLNAIGVPVSDSERATAVHDNRREKPLFLIEAKRRLNVFTKTLGRDVNLELEHALRERGKAMLSSGAPDITINEISPAFSKAEMRKLKLENTLLSRAGLVDLPLELETSAHALSKEEKLRISAAADDLFWHGLGLASGFVKATPNAPNAPFSSLKLYSEASNVCRAALTKELVSVHIGAPETAILAACKERRIVRLILDQSQEAYKVARSLDALPLPSPVVALIVKDLHKHTVQSLMLQYSFPAPDLLVVSCMEALPSTESMQEELVLRSILTKATEGPSFALYSRDISPPTGHEGCCRKSLT